MNIAFHKENEEIILYPIKKEGQENIYHLIDSEKNVWMELELAGAVFELINRKEGIIDSEDSIKAKLDQLVLKVVEARQSGIELTDIDLEDEINPFNPEDIKIHAKQFSLRLISDMIDEGEIDLAPDFQRNFVWNSIQKSRMIESILLRIPLPMFYFSEDNEGRITVIDGLQRLTTIKEFMDNKFSLRKLEYLRDSCDKRYYKTDGKKKGIDAKYLRWFNQTLFSVNVIDPSSPPKVKYDIFRRINTGGKSLNNQEIRNRFAGRGLRETLKAMTRLPEFHSAVNYSIKSRRMEDQEMALRFILFYDLISNSEISDYTGYMNDSLDDVIERYSGEAEENLTNYISLFSNAMKNAEYLFGKYAFRKIRLKDLEPEAHKKLINKALFVSCSVLLSGIDHDALTKNNKELGLLHPLAKAIEEDDLFLNYLSYGTNGRNNLLYVFEKVEELITKSLKHYSIEAFF